MKHATLLWGCLVASSLLALMGCRDTPTEPERAVPPPEVRAASDIDAPVDTFPDEEHPALYYYIFNNENKRFDEDDNPETILRTLLERDLALEEAWYPIVSSIKVPCAAPNVYPAFVVRLTAPNDDIEELGFVSDPSPNTPNCGIEQFEYYRFE